jgi:hypothetical protein
MLAGVVVAASTIRVAATSIMHDPKTFCFGGFSADDLCQKEGLPAGPTLELHE